MIQARAVTDEELAAVPDELAEVVARQLAFGFMTDEGPDFRDDWDARPDYRPLWEKRLTEARRAAAVALAQQEAEHDLLLGTIRELGVEATVRHCQLNTVSSLDLAAWDESGRQTQAWVRGELPNQIPGDFGAQTRYKIREAMVKAGMSRDRAAELVPEDEENR